MREASWFMLPLVTISMLFIYCSTLEKPEVPWEKKVTWAASIGASSLCCYWRIWTTILHLLLSMGSLKGKCRWLFILSIKIHFPLLLLPFSYIGAFFGASFGVSYIASQLLFWNVWWTKLKQQLHTFHFLWWLNNAAYCNLSREYKYSCR